MRYLFLLAAIALGVAAMAEGQRDDSPGLGGIGLIIIIAAVAYGMRSVRRGRAGVDR